MLHGAPSPEIPPVPPDPIRLALLARDTASHAVEAAHMATLNATAMRVLMAFTLAGREPTDAEVARVVRAFVPDEMEAGLPGTRSQVQRICDDVLALAAELRAKPPSA